MRAAWTEHKRFTPCCQELNLAWTWLAPAALLRHLSPLLALFGHAGVLMERPLRGVIADMDCLAKPNALFTDVDSRISSPGSPAGSFPGHDGRVGSLFNFNRTSAPIRASKRRAAPGGGTTSQALPY
jgi:hypothetical protein